ncbi:uncharacterized protein LOC119673912 [Teleopsis dalmanni]|uniref:uncharacterized protein LOC119673912 n=1 Tax=Teleopsis dalmanni TaxID=139649 RepID=UPI0018CE9534|nr:uncharacterized protein LOC119673912 [Teleopsis dalmanni]
MKVWIAFIFVLAYILAGLFVLGGDQSWGIRSPTDKLLLHKRLIWPVAHRNGLNKYYSYFQNNRHESKKYRITRIELKDLQMSPFRKLKPKIVSGGVNRSHVVIRIRSKRSSGIMYDLKIYGRKRRWTDWFG